MVSRPVYVGGLGFGYKWDMGWMHDTLEYMRQDPIFRKYHHDKLTFRMIYAFSENFVLPLSHDEVVLRQRLAAGEDARRRLAEVRQPAAAAGLHVRPAGQEAALHGRRVRPVERMEPRRRASTGNCCNTSRTRGLRQWVDDLNRAYRREPALHRFDCDPRGFQWIDCRDSDQSVLTFLRKGQAADADILVACNFTPVPRVNYRVGATPADSWEEILNSDALTYGGSGWGNLGSVESSPVPSHGFPASVVLTLPPLAIVFFKAAKRRGRQQMLSRDLRCRG